VQQDPDAAVARKRAPTTARFRRSALARDRQLSRCGKTEVPRSPYDSPLP